MDLQGFGFRIRVWGPGGGLHPVMWGLGSGHRLHHHRPHLVLCGVPLVLGVLQPHEERVQVVTIDRTWFAAVRYGLDERSGAWRACTEAGRFASVASS